MKIFSTVKEENEQIKEGIAPESFTTNVNQLAQKDTDARWTVKNKISYFGYKNHVKADSKTKLITAWHGTSNTNASCRKASC